MSGEKLPVERDQVQPRPDEAAPGVPEHGMFGVTGSGDTSGFGGLVGILGGVGLANIIRFLLKRWVELPAVHTPIWAIAIAFGFCAFLGILFGIYPAAKASKLDPIEALRYE